MTNMSRRFEQIPPEFNGSHLQNMARLDDKNGDIKALHLSNPIEEQKKKTHRREKLDPTKSLKRSSIRKKIPRLSPNEAIKKVQVTCGRKSVTTSN